MSLMLPLLLLSIPYLYNCLFLFVHLIIVAHFCVTITFDNCILYFLTYYKLFDDFLLKLNQGNISNIANLYLFDLCQGFIYSFIIFFDLLQII